MHAMTLHAQAGLWHHGRGATFAALFMEGEMRSPDTEVNRTDVLLYAVLNRGLRLATDLPRLALEPRPGWAVGLNPAGALTLTWPHAQPLLLDAPVNLPAGWPEAAAQHGLMLLFVGDSLRLRNHTKDHHTNPGQRSAQAAERGELAAGAITYPRQQQEPRPARQTDPKPRSRAHRLGPHTAVAPSPDTLSTAHLPPRPWFPFGALSCCSAMTVSRSGITTVINDRHTMATLGNVSTFSAAEPPAPTTPGTDFLRNL